MRRSSLLIPLGVFTAARRSGPRRGGDGRSAAPLQTGAADEGAPKDGVSEVDVVAREPSTFFHDEGPMLYIHQRWQATVTHETR
jgi:hypothetical protein